MSTKPATLAPTSKKGGTSSTQKTSSQQFIGMALNMGWQLAVVVLVPIVGGATIDKAANTKPMFTLIGLVLAAVGIATVLWRTLQIANSMPVPKLTEAERREVQKRYEEEDED